MIVLDTNILSETLRVDPADSVRRWMAAQHAASLFTTAISKAEILRGLALMPPGRRRAIMEKTAAAMFAEDFAGRILSFDSAAAEAFADIAAGRRKLGRPISVFDAQIAAIALIHKAAVATRNVTDFASCGIDIINPWEK